MLSQASLENACAEICQLYIVLGYLCSSTYACRFDVDEPENVPNESLCRWAGRHQAQPCLRDLFVENEAQAIGTSKTSGTCTYPSQLILTSATYVDAFWCCSSAKSLARHDVFAGFRSAYDALLVELSLEPGMFRGLVYETLSRSVKISHQRER